MARTTKAPKEQKVDKKLAKKIAEKKSLAGKIRELKDVEIQNKISDGYMFISESTMSQKSAENYALQLYSGSLPLTIETVGNQVLTVSAGIGETAILGLAIAAGALVLALLIFFIVRYREFGLMIMLSMLLFIGLMLFLLQAMPIYEISIEYKPGGTYKLVKTTVGSYEAYIDKIVEKNAWTVECLHSLGSGSIHSSYDSTISKFDYLKVKGVWACSYNEIVQYRRQC